MSCAEVYIIHTFVRPPASLDFVLHTKLGGNREEVVWLVKTCCACFCFFLLLARSFVCRFKTRAQVRVETNFD